MFPPELLRNVFESPSLSKKDRKESRQVCRAFDQAAAPSVFSQIHISYNTFESRVASSRASHNISKRLSSSSIFYGEVEDEAYFRGWPGLIDEKEIAEAALSCGDGHLFGHKHEVLDGKFEREDGLMSSDCPLSFALRNLPSVRRLVLTNAPSSVQRPIFKMVKALDCRNEDCPYRRYGPHNPWYTTLLALATSKSSITELIADPARPIGLRPSTSELLPAQLENVQPWIRRVVNLQLRIEVDDNSGESYIVHRNTNELLRGATNLECLALHVWGSPSESRQLGVILGGCAFSKLRKLRLTGFSSNETELLELLRGSSRIYKLELDCFVLTSGTWEHLISETRAALTLTEATFGRLSGGSLELGEDEKFSDYFDAVRDFCLYKGENPFTKKAMERYVERRDVEGLEGTWTREGIFE